MESLLILHIGSLESLSTSSGATLERIYLDLLNPFDIADFLIEML